LFVVAFDKRMRWPSRSRELAALRATYRSALSAAGFKAASRQGAPTQWARYKKVTGVQGE